MVRIIFRSLYIIRFGKDQESLINNIVFITHKLDSYKPKVGQSDLFMGGEWHKEELINFLKISKSRNLKTCLYTGLEDVDEEIKFNLDYFKIGHWDKRLGGLKNVETNQRFIDAKTGEILNFKFNKVK
jgi:anaerobic ribonucleoside-triphosphate reductase activating protein